MDWTGLAAETWDYFKTDDRDYDYYLDLISGGDGGVLDVGCGTGRLLVPLLAAGFDV